MSSPQACANPPLKGNVARGGSWVWMIVLAALFAGAGLLLRTLAREAVFFRTRTEQGTRALLAPGELDSINEKIAREQRELIRVQNEIKRRLDGR